MQPTSYTITFSAEERRALIMAAGHTYPEIPPAGLFITAPQFLELSKKLMDARPDAQAARQQSGTAAAAAIAAPPAPANGESRAEFERDRFGTAGPVEKIDRWSADRKGNRQAPDVFDSKNLVVTSVTHVPRSGEKAEFWRIQFRGFKANCFDKEIAAFLTAAAQKQDAMTVYVKASGNYTNVVGVRA